MANIEYIKNVTAFTSLNNKSGQFSTTITGIPNQNPDELVVRMINYNGPAGDAFQYLIWCSLTNDYIGSFVGENISPSSPQITIRLNAPITNNVDFKFYRILEGGVLEFPENFVGNVCIHLDLIKYKKTPIHA